MSSFFSRGSKSASSSTTSLKTKGDGTHQIFTTPPKEASVKKKWEYNEEQLKQIEELKAYSKTLLLPESDPYHPWELRFLSDPGTHPRYMRAAKWKMDDAKKRIHGTIEWRREYKPELIQPGDVGVEAETGKIILTGFDLDARPILYMRPGRENTERSPRQIRHLIYHLERAIDLMPPGQEQVAIIVDYKSATSQTNPSIGVARQVLGILQNHYVERLGRGLVTNMPWWINAFFTGISPFLDPITRDKIRFNPKLTELVPASQLDAEFGGDYNFDFEHKAYWKTITEFCHIAEDGTRVNDAGEKWYPPSGNGIQAAVDGLHPAPGAVASGDVHKVESGQSTPIAGASASASGAVAATGVAGGAAAGAAGAAKAAEAASEPKNEEDIEAPPPSYLNGNSNPNEEKVLANGSGIAKENGSTDENGLEEGVKRMSLNRALTTVPGAPEGDAVFDHPPTEGEKKIARESLDQAR